MSLKYVLFLLLCSPCLASDFFISATGSPKNPGTRQSPWDVSGVVALTNGNRVIALTNSGPFTTTIRVPPGSGPGLLLSDPGTMAVVTVTNGYGIVFSYQPALCSGIGVVGFDVHGCGLDGVATTGSGNWLSNCWIYSNYWQGVNLSYAGNSNDIVDSCLIERNGLIALGNPNNLHYHGVYASGPNITVRNCVIRNNSGAGIQYYTGYPNCWQNGSAFYNNLIYGHEAFFDLVIWSAIDGGAMPGTNSAYGNTLMSPISARYGLLKASNNNILPNVQFAGDILGGFKCGIPPAPVPPPNYGVAVLTNVTVLIPKGQNW